MFKNLGWKTITGTICTAVSILWVAFGGDQAVGGMFAAAGVALGGVGARSAIAKGQQAAQAEATRQALEINDVKNGVASVLREFQAVSQSDNR